MTTTKVFIGGSRRVSRLSPLVRARLDKIIDKGFDVIVGDANGADKAVQQYLSIRRYGKVEVFCSGTVCRNNVGHWQTRPIDTNAPEKSRQFYSAKDRAMSNEATYGFMLWDGRSAGTLLNVLRLLRKNKKVLVYQVSGHRFSELKAYDQWDSFIAPYGSALRSEAEQKAQLEDRDHRRRQQPGLPLQP